MRVQVQWLKEGSPDRSSFGSAYLSEGDSATVGRETGVDIQLRDISVSRLHAEIYVEDGAVTIKDAGSTNGTTLEGKQVVQSRWEPGQSVRIGSYRLSLVALSGAPDRPRAEVPEVVRSVPEISPVVPSGTGSVELGDVYQRAKKNDPQAVRQLFTGFLGRNETVINAGYLGALGLIFPEHSFWCITNARICGMVVNASGRLDFTFCFLKAVDVAHFHQPSRVGLWVTIIFYLLIVASIGCGFIAGGLIAGITPVGFVLFILGLLVFAGGIYLIPLVTRFYYRFTKSGCAFFTKEHVYMAILADRSNLKAAQSMLRLFEEQKRALGG
jgi:FHA domain